jgi:hypothetical protein
MLASHLLRIVEARARAEAESPFRPADTGTSYNRGERAKAN